MPIIIYIFTLWPEVAAAIVLQGERFKLRSLYNVSESEFLQIRSHKVAPNWDDSLLTLASPCTYVLNVLSSELKQIQLSLPIQLHYFFQNQDKNTRLLKASGS